MDKLSSFTSTSILLSKLMDDFRRFGLWTPSENLLILFAEFMAIVGFFMLKKNTFRHIVTDGNSNLVLLKKNVSLLGFSVGVLAGYFGTGGRFLIVPIIIYSGGLNIVNAIGTLIMIFSSLIRDQKLPDNVFQISQRKK